MGSVSFAPGSSTPKPPRPMLGEAKRGGTSKYFGSTYRFFNSLFGTASNGLTAGSSKAVASRAGGSQEGLAHEDDADPTAGIGRMSLVDDAIVDDEDAYSGEDEDAYAGQQRRRLAELLPHLPRRLPTFGRGKLHAAPAKLRTPEGEGSERGGGRQAQLKKQRSAFVGDEDSRGSKTRPRRERGDQPIQQSV